MSDILQKIKCTLDNELIHGFNAGIGQSIVGHPLDTFKTWRQIGHTEKISVNGLLRGWMYPAFTNGLINGAGFRIYEGSKKSFDQNGAIIGGITAGCTMALMSGYFEYKKIIKQLNIKISFPPASIVTLLMREIPACLFYFPVYDELRERKISVFMSGGIAGLTCWTSSYWADVLNTHVMSGKTLTATIKTLKMKDYFRGMNIVLPRAFIVNAVGYFFYEQSKLLLKN